MGKLVHTCLGSSYVINDDDLLFVLAETTTHVLHCPPPPPAHRFIISPAVINTHTGPGHTPVRDRLPVDSERERLCESKPERARNYP
jgi:hypothetical protein